MARLALFFAATALAVACKPAAAPSTTEASCVGPEGIALVNATVLTMDPQREARAKLRVLGDRVAPDDLPDACFRVLDLGGATILPGIIDGHVHVRELGMDAVKVDLVGAEDLTEIVRRLKAAHPTPAPGQWIVGQGWDEGAFASAGYPDARPLAEAFPDNPVALESLHGFAGMFNTKALELAGVHAKTPDPEGGTILRRDDGTPTGVLLALAQTLVTQHVPAPTLEDRKRAIVAGLERMMAEGVTSVHEAGMAREDVEAFMALADAGELPIRVYGMLTGNDEALMKEWFERGPLEHAGGFLTIRGVKVFYDGSLGSRTAVLVQPYADAHDLAAPAERITPQRIVELGQRAAPTGFQLAVHAIGDEGNRRVLEAFATALAEHPAVDHRWRIEHAQVVTPEFFTDAKRLGVIASMQPSHAVGDSDWAEARLGPERVTRAYAWRTMLEAGIPLIFNSDLPGEPWTPMQTLYFAVTRQKLDGTPEGGWKPEQRVTTQEALQAMTRSSAYAAFAEDRLGTLAPGYKADFVVVDRNPLESEPAQLKDIQVLETWIDGKRVWSQGERNPI